MTSAPSLQSFLAEGATKLSDAFFSESQNCSSCLSSDAAVLPNHSSASLITTRSSTAVVRTNACSHVFHKQCLEFWLLSQTTSSPIAPRAGTCPDCRHILVEPATTSTPTPSPLSRLHMQLTVAQRYYEPCESQRIDSVRQLEELPSMAAQALASVSRLFRPGSCRSGEAMELRQLREERRELELEGPGHAVRAARAREEVERLEEAIREVQRVQRGAIQDPDSDSAVMDLHGVEV